MIEDIRIAAENWQSAHETRRLEWQSLIAEMLLPGECVFTEHAEGLTLGTTEQSFELTLSLSDETSLHASIPHDALDALIREYVDTVRAMSNVEHRGTSARLEALDMAKKVTHDKAGRRLLVPLQAFGIDHPTARRIFSLLVALKVDTTRLYGIHGHRAIR